MDEYSETRQSESAGDTPELERLRGELDASRTAERAAVERLRVALLASEPALDESMVGGETLADVEASFAAASAVVARLRERAAAESASRIPAGAPGRLAPKPRTAFEKIREGLGRTG